MKFYSGGATGSDYRWEKSAKLHVPHHPFYIVSFDSHQVTTCNHGVVMKIDRKLLKQADEYLYFVLRKIKRFLPCSDYTCDLFRRDFFQVLEVDDVFTISELSDDKKEVIEGAIYGVNYAQILKKNIFTLYQLSAEWHKFDYEKQEFVVLENMPKIENDTALISTRDILPYAISEIEKVFASSFKS
jgi:hypothetical protein